jgi:hypothetical protein
MAKGEARGVKGYIPSVRGIVKILIVLVVIKVIVSYALPSLPASVQKFTPVF